MSTKDLHIPEVNREKSAHVLAIRLSAMGDVAMTVPVIRTFMATYPNCKITFLTRPFFAPMFKGIPNIEIYKADVKGEHNGVMGLGRLARELRNHEIEMVADLHNVLRSNVLKSVFYLYGIPVKQIDKGRAEKKKLTQEDHKRFRELKSTHQRYADVFTELGFPLDFSNHVFPEKQQIPTKIDEIVSNSSKKYLGIAPFAQHDSKVYPADLMEKVLEKLNTEDNTQIFLFGGGSAETKKLQSWEKQFENCISVAGLLSFEEELALISNLDAMLSMDSGNGHMAAMYGIPVVSIWGVTHPFAGFKPFGQPLENSLIPDLEKFPKIPTSIYGNKYPEGYEFAIRTITPARVVKKINSVLN
ncbi:glycosyltransferase family 9 protein [Zunongwangia endophytica]|uniref:Glycosyltransferase family 9 protein n=1 Tax=Zunongwangia endophytica TaxID=1808945 RepID=A0ABV8H8F0_9FLAO|nr:glycosyltransferase family 9 protein [Zunongwangia endophytica]MDN3595893.1 glycosyltransferase family 9 protein [Zunongwangia endophytica]